MKPIIRSSLTSIIILFTLALFGCSASPELGSNKRTLNSQMQEMINVLNAGHYSDFISTYVSPSYIKSEGGVNGAMLQFERSEQVALPLALEAAKNIQPLFNEKNNTMTYASNKLPKPLIFKMENGKWYLTGDWFVN